MMVNESRRGGDGSVMMRKIGDAASVAVDILVFSPSLSMYRYGRFCGEDHICHARIFNHHLGTHQKK